MNRTMIKKKLLKLITSTIKLFLPLLSWLFIKLRVNKRVINYLNDKSFLSNNYYNFSNIIDSLLIDEKIFALDVGAQGGFNCDQFFSKKYNNFFEAILVEPIEEEAKKLKNNYKYVINKGLWSSECKKKIYILGNRPGSSSMYIPNKEFFKIHSIKDIDYDKFNVTETIEIDCVTLGIALRNLDINRLDYLKLDTQGSELEILKGMGGYKPLLIRTEVHINSMYKNVPSWGDLLKFFNDMNYIPCDWKGIGSHSTRIPAEMDMVFIPNFKTNIGKTLIVENEKKFTSLMLIFGQLELLKQIGEDLKLDSIKTISSFEDRFFF